MDVFSSNVKDILKKFEFYNQIDKMADSHIIDAVIDKFVSSEILNLYFDFKDNEYSKIFDNKDFGYYKITVDRPLKVAVNLRDEKFEKIETIYSKLGIGTEKMDRSKLKEYGLKETKTSITELSNSKKMMAYLDILKQLISDEVYLDVSDFTSRFNILAKATKIKGLSYSSLEKTGLTELMIEKNEKASIQRNNKGDIVVDPGLRDTEIVPLNYSGGISQFMKDEVLPYHEDAFVSDADTKIGYEISFTKYFYKPKELDRVEDIVRRIKKLEEETDGVLESILEGLYE